MRNLLLYLLVVLACCTACKKATYFNVSTEEISSTVAGSSDTILVSTDGSWKVGDVPEWVKVIENDASIICLVSPNSSGSDREGSITLTSGSFQHEVRIHQPAICSVIQPDRSEVSFPPEGGTEVVGVQFDGLELHIEAPEGFTATYADKQLTIKAAGKESVGRGSGDIVLSCDSVVATVSVTQQGKLCPRCNGAGKILCPRCGGNIFIPGTVCSSCGGLGVHACCGYSGMETCRARHDANGRVVCPECGGR